MDWYHSVYVWNDLIVLFSVDYGPKLHSRTYGEWRGDGLDNKFMFELEWYVHKKL